MTVTTDHLKRVHDFAVAQQYDKFEAVSVMILLLHKRFGYDFKDAYDALLGQDAYYQTALEVYDELQARA